jgi:hypothetical protein
MACAGITRRAVPSGDYGRAGSATGYPKTLSAYMLFHFFQTHETTSRTALLVLANTILAGCGSVAIPPTYTQDELKAECERHGGWWRPDDLLGGYCDFRKP